MRMGWTALTMSVASLGIVTPMFCSTCLIHRGSNLGLLKKCVRDILKAPAHLEIRFASHVEPDPYNVAVVRMLDFYDLSVVRPT